MYARTLSIYDFRCFGKAVLDLRHPDQTDAASLELPNVNLILGDNGGGKSSVLRAIAIAALAPALLESGFVPYRLVRRGSRDAKTADPAASLLKLVCDLDKVDLAEAKHSKATIDLLARIERRTTGNSDRLHLDSTPRSPIEKLIFDERSHAFFVVGYGATRRTETGDYVEGSHRKTRGVRYQRVAGLFEDHVALRPMQSWLPRIKSATRRREAVQKIARLLPSKIRFDGAYDEDEGQYMFGFEGTSTPFTALSDGYKAFIGWCGDLIGHLCDVAPDNLAIDRISGIVLVDEIDLHLHPAWQRTVLSTLSQSFPRLQFVVTTHSPLVASSARRENIFLTETSEDGTATVKQIAEKAFGRSVDQMLLSSYFGLSTIRSPEFVGQAQTLFERAAEGDSDAALAYLTQLAAPTRSADELAPEFTAALQKTQAATRTAKAPPVSAKKPAATKTAEKRMTAKPGSAGKKVARKAAVKKTTRK